MAWIRSFWPIIIALVTLSAIAGESRMQITHNQESIASIKKDDLKEIKEELRDISQSVQRQAVTGVRQETYLSGIHEQLQEIKKELRGHSLPPSIQ